MKSECSCSRCREVKTIPTHQFVKFDLAVRYLCDRCWKQFRSWYNHGQKPGQLELFESGA